jgi:hypothetical protein
VVVPKEEAVNVAGIKQTGGQCDRISKQWRRKLGRGQPHGGPERIDAADMVGMEPGLEAT